MTISFAVVCYLMIFLTQNLSQFMLLLRTSSFVNAQLYFLALILWFSLSGGKVIDSLIEYRAFWMAPILINFLLYFFSKNDLKAEDFFKLLIFVAIFGFFINFAISFLNSIDIIQWRDAKKSIGGKIYNASVSTAILSLTPILIVQKEAILRYLGFLVVLLTSISVFYIDTGRTGYVLFFFIAAVSLLFGKFDRFFEKKYLPLTFAIILVAIFVLSSDIFLHTVTKTMRNFELAFSGESFKSSIGYRYSFYLAGIQFFLDSPFVGHGFGGLETLLNDPFETGNMVYPTTNLHSDWITFLVAGGVLLALGYLVVFLSLFYDLFSLYQIKSPYFFSIIIISSIFFCGGLVNGFQGDFGEKNIWVLFVSLIYVVSFLQTSRSEKLYA